MAGNLTKDMTVGHPRKIILSFGVPLLLGMLFQQFYSMVDTIIVGESKKASDARITSIHFPVLRYFALFRRYFKNSSGLISSPSCHIRSRS